MSTYDAAHFSSFFDAYGEREWERKLCQEPGNLDGGTHLIAAVRRT